MLESDNARGGCYYYQLEKKKKSPLKIPRKHSVIILNNKEQMFLKSKCRYLQLRRV